MSPTTDGTVVHRGVDLHLVLALNFQYPVRSELWVGHCVGLELCWLQLWSFIIVASDNIDTSVGRFLLRYYCCSYAHTNSPLRAPEVGLSPPAHFLDELFSITSLVRT